MIVSIKWSLYNNLGTKWYIINKNNHWKVKELYVQRRVLPEINLLKLIENP